MEMPAHVLFFGLALLGVCLLAGVFLFQTDKPYPQPPRSSSQMVSTTNPVAIAGKTLPTFATLDIVKCIMQSVFLLAALYMVVSVNRISFYVGTLKRQLAALAHDGVVPSLYDSMALYELPLVSFVLFPIPGRTMDKFGISGTIFICNLLHLIWGVLAVVPRLSIQIVTILVFGVARLFTFATYFALIGAMFVLSLA
jgi:hypothetical protein